MQKNNGIQGNKNPTHPMYFLRRGLGVWGRGKLVFFKKTWFPLSPKKQKLSPLAAGGLACVFLLILAAVTGPHFYINTTPSVPVGLYAPVPEAIKAGSYVVFDLPEDNPFYALATEQNYRITKLHKQIVALPGELYSLPEASTKDSKGRPVQGFTPRQGVVPEGMAIVLGETGYSLDSRFYGPVPMEAMQVVRPVWVKETETK